MLGFAPLGQFPLAAYSLPFVAPVNNPAGRPMRFTALPDRFTFRAELQPMTFTALPQSFTFRGVPE